MIINFWKGVTFYCINGHDNPVQMTVKEGRSPFFACPKYMLKDDGHPDGHGYGEKACTNQLSYSDAERVVSMLAKTVQESAENGEIADYTGYVYNYRHIHVTVLKYKEGDIRLGILNNRAIAKG